jgi:hypothetical protein
MSQLFSYLSILPFELREKLLLLLPPKEIISKVSQIEDFEKVGHRETFWERVWRKWFSPQLPNSLTVPLSKTIFSKVEKAQRLTPEQLLKKGLSKGILFYVCEALEQKSYNSIEKDKALFLAAKNGHLSTVVYLVESGASISTRESKALREAVYYGHLEIVKYLVESGAKISA